MIQMGASLCGKSSHRSADEILANYLQQQEAQLLAATVNSNNKKRTHLSSTLSCSKNTKPYKVTSPVNQLDCRNLNSPTASNDNFSFLNRTSSSTTRRFETSQIEGETSSNLMQIQRKLLAFFYIYVLIIVSLYLTYAVYCYYQQNQFKKQQQELLYQSTQVSGCNAPASSLVMATVETDQQQQQQQFMKDIQSKLEGKIQLLERYIELLAVDLESTKTRLSEREKCACSINCSFNGTKYADQSSWMQKCDLCKCQAGKISCQPRQCPKLSCQDERDAVIQTLPGQCCPSCMKKCKLNKGFVKHGHEFQPVDSTTGRQSAKNCKCLNGLIKCEPIAISTRSSQDINSDKNQPSRAVHLGQIHTVDNNGAQSINRGSNKTIEYLKSILGPKFKIV